MKISVVINTYNADRCLESVLKSVANYDEILICDMYSTDRTIEIAEKYNCKIIYHEHTGIVEPAREFAISQATHDWILVVDADECIPSILKDYLIETIKDKPNVAAIRIPRKNYFLGKVMRANYPNYITRFVNKQKVQWPSRIHTRPIIDGEVFWVPKKRKDLAFIHHAVASISDNTEKNNRYTDFEVPRRLKRSNTYLSLFTGPFSRFFRGYVLKGGFRDGKAGLIWTLSSAFYSYLAISKAIEAKMTIDDFDPNMRKYFEEDIIREEAQKKAAQKQL